MIKLSALSQTSHRKAQELDNLIFIEIPTFVRHIKKKLTADRRGWTQMNADKFVPQQTRKFYRRKNTSITRSEKQILNKILNTQVLTSCFFSIFLGLSQTVLAGYEPPKDQKPPVGHSDSSGVRGGCKTKVGGYVHQQKTNPFIWVISDNHPLVRQFNLYEFSISTTNDSFVEANIHTKNDIQHPNFSNVLLANSTDNILASWLTIPAKLQG